MTPAALLARVCGRGGRVRLEGDRLIVRGVSRLAPADLADLRAHRDSLIAAIRARRVPAWGDDGRLCLLADPDGGEPWVVASGGVP